MKQSVELPSKLAPAPAPPIAGTQKRQANMVWRGRLAARALWRKLAEVLPLWLVLATYCVALEAACGLFENEGGAGI